MEVFKDKTTAGHEQAFKRGAIVPDGAVNLAYIKAPELTPAQNIVVLSTTNLAQPSSADDLTHVYSSNPIGILVSQTGEVVTNEFPIISDEFLGPDATQGQRSYRTSDVLSHVHVSRYLHVDFVSIVPDGTIPYTYKANSIKVIDGNGHEFLAEDGSRLYKTKVIKLPIAATAGSSTAYRVFVYVSPLALNQTLYVTYDKIEVDDTGRLFNQVPGYKEILNPQAYFTYVPEEADVVDPANRDEKWYSSKSLALKYQLIRSPQLVSADGYEVYVPQKAIPDSRIFQLFRWRLKCEFDQAFKVEENSTHKVVYCGVAITNSCPVSQTPYVFLNLEKSSYNQLSISFDNPLWSGPAGQAGIPPREQAEYWYVNLDTVSQTDLAKFDILVWSPAVQTFDFSPYAGLMDFFGRVSGKTLFIDSNNATVFKGIAGVTVTPPVNNDGTVINDSNQSSGGSFWADATTYTPSSTTTGAYYDASKFGGWKLGGNDLVSLSWKEDVPSPSKSHFFLYNTGYKPVMMAKDNNYVPASITFKNLSVHPKTLDFFSGSDNPSTLNTLSYTPQNDGSLVPLGNTYLKFEVIGAATATNALSLNGATYTNTMRLTGSGFNVQASTAAQNLNYYVHRQTGYLVVGPIPTNDQVFGSQSFGTISMWLNSDWATTMQSAILTISAYSYNPITYTYTAQSGGSNPVMVDLSYPNGGRIVLSTASVLESCNALFGYNNDVLIDINSGLTVSGTAGYGNYVNSPYVEGAYKFLYNTVLMATQKDLSKSFDLTGSFGSSYAFYTNWLTSWVIDGDVLDKTELGTYQFSYLPTS